VLGVQAGLTSVANEVVLVMVEGAESTSARGLRRPARRRGWGRRRRIRINRLWVGREDVHTPVTMSSSQSSRKEPWDWRRAGLRRGESGERERGESGEGEWGEWRRRWGECGHCGSVN
jgi:hypothetical protein